MKFAHIADLHLGYRQYGLEQREEDFFKAALYIVDKIKDVDFCIIAGDLFHNKNITPRTLSQANEIISSLKRVYIASGNHDNYRWLEYLSKQHENLYCGDGTYYVSDACIQIVDWHSKSEVTPCKSKYNILVIHGGIEGEDPNFRISRELFAQYNERYDYIALGHIHRKYISGRAHNPSSLERCSVLDEPGGAFVIENGEVSFVKGISRKFVTVTDTYDDVKDAIVYVVSQDVDINPIREKALYVKVKVFDAIEKRNKITSINEDSVIKEITKLDVNFVKKQLVEPNIGDINEFRC